MTKVEKLSELMGAWYNGQPLEHEVDGHWRSCWAFNSLDMLQDPFKFRVKKDFIVPWTPSEVPLGAIIRNKCGGVGELILAVLPSGVVNTYSKTITLQALLDNYEYRYPNETTWSLCGTISTVC